MTTNPWMSLWTYIGLFVALALVGLALFGTSRMRQYDPIPTKTDQAFQRDKRRDKR